MRLRAPTPDRAARALAGAVALGALLAPALAAAHERWVPNKPRFPVNRAYFQSMSGEVLLFSLAAAAAVFGVVVAWYLSAPRIVDALTPALPSARAREAARPWPLRAARLALRFLLDGPVDGPFMRRGLAAASFVFTRVPAFVLALGAWQGWLVMPSFPLPDSDLGLALRVASGVLALWCAIGLFLRPLGVIFFLVFGYLVVAYDIAAIDAIPVLASAFFYLFHRKGERMNGRQLLGMRLSLGVGFFLLGLVNKILLGPELFVGVGDQHPDLLIGPQALYPALSREAWSFTTALGEMVFGLLLLFGVFNRITAITLALVFGNFIAFFGLAEIVHVYPIAGFVLLLFRGAEGTSLDGVVFRLNLGFWRRFQRAPSRLVYGGAVTTVAGAAAALLMLLPLILVVEVVPVLADTRVPPGYRPPPPPPPAAKWPAIAPSAHDDHRPQHGGVVTSPGDVHVEVVVAASGTVALYPTDAQRRPIPLSEARGTLRIDRPGGRTTLALRADASGALTAAGPPPRTAAEYTYLLTIRGAPAALTLRVPPGGTDALARGGR